MTISVDEGWLISFGPEQRFAAIDQLKNEIVAAVSHELKTPVATIKAYATTMRTNPSTFERDGAEYLTTIEEQADRLTRAIEDILRVGRVDPAHLLTRRRAVTVDELLAGVESRLGPTAASRIERRSTSVRVHCDPDLFAEALARVLDNALKFSADTASVAIEARDREDTVTIVVSDRGIGIGPEHLPYIFERFYRAEGSLTPSTSGTGLGLAIVRDIVHAHGGTIDVESTPHQGTTFTIVFPARAESEAHS